MWKGVCCNRSLLHGSTQAGLGATNQLREIANYIRIWELRLAPIGILMEDRRSESQSRRPFLFLSVAAHTQRFLTSVRRDQTPTTLVGDLRRRVKRVTSCPRLGGCEGKGNAG